MFLATQLAFLADLEIALQLGHAGASQLSQDPKCLVPDHHVYVFFVDLLIDKCAQSYLVGHSLRSDKSFYFVHKYFAFELKQIEVFFGAPLLNSAFIG